MVSLLQHAADELSTSMDWRSRGRKDEEIRNQKDSIFTSSNRVPTADLTSKTIICSRHLMYMRSIRSSYGHVSFHYDILDPPSPTSAILVSRHEFHGRWRPETPCPRTILKYLGSKVKNYPSEKRPTEGSRHADLFIRMYRLYIYIVYSLETGHRQPSILRSQMQDLPWLSQYMRCTITHLEC